MSGGGGGPGHPDGPPRSICFLCPPSPLIVVRQPLASPTCRRAALGERGLRTTGLNPCPVHPSSAAEPPRVALGGPAVLRTLPPPRFRYSRFAVASGGAPAHVPPPPRFRSSSFAVAGSWGVRRWHHHRTVTIALDDRVPRGGGGHLEKFLHMSCIAVCGIMKLSTHRWVCWAARAPPPRRPSLSSAVAGSGASCGGSPHHSATGAVRWAF